MITVGSLYSGYDGLGLALARVSALPLHVLWHCDPDPDCAATLAKHHPGVPNLGSDTFEWSAVERPEVVTLGPPCQPASVAGLGLGLDDPRWRWPYARVALEYLRPALIFFENVAGLTQGRMRHLWDDILADMHALGYQVGWTVIGACVVGAPHHRHRLFAVGRLRAAPAAPARHGERALCVSTGAALLPTPVARDGDPSQRGEGSAEYWARRRAERPTEGVPLGAAVRLLPTPLANGGRRGHNSTNVRGEPDLNDVARPRRRQQASDAANGGPNQDVASGDIALSSAVHAERWGGYTGSVAGWESILGREAPAPTEPTARGGGQRHAPALPEWMMGLDAGYLTGHLGRPAALRLAGNGVCPQQGAAAFRLLWPLASA